MAATLTACTATPPPTVTPTPFTTAGTTPSASPQPAAPQPRIALLGDGLLDGWGLPDDQALPTLLARARTDLLVLDLGLGDESSDKVLTRDRDASEQHLDAVLIWAGSYDAHAGNSPQQYATNMARILDDLRGTPVLLLPPITTPGAPDAAPYAAGLQTVAAQRGIPLLDIGTVARHADWQQDGRFLGPRSDAALAALLVPKLPPPAATTAPRQKRAVLIGDSLSYGAELDAPQDLPSALRSLRPDLDVICTAVGGQESGDALSRARQFRLLRPDVAVIWLGGQDAIDHVPVADFRRNLNRLVDAMLPATVVLVTPIPDYGEGDASLYVPYAAATRDLAHTRTLTLVDLPAFPRSAYQDDGTHLAAAAELQVAQRYAQAI